MTRKTENSTYQVSKTVTRMKLEKGAIKRLSVAVIVDHKSATDSAGKRVLTPRTAPEMKTIRDLIVAAAGILEQRGDLLTVENLPFEGPEIPVLGPPAPVVLPPSWLEALRVLFTKEWWAKYRYVVMGAGVGFLAALAGWLFWRLRKAPGKKKAAAEAAPQVTGAEERMGKQLADLEAAQRHADEQAMIELKMPQVTSNKAMVLRKLINDTAKKDPTSTVQLLRSWIHENES